MSQEEKMIMTLTGPSCAGKSYLEAHLIERHPEVFSRLLSHTTRPMREGEVDGVDYLFITEDEFAAMLVNGKFTQTVDYGNYQYGTTWDTLEAVIDDGKVPLVVVEPTGVEQFEKIAKACGHQVFSVLVTHSMEVIMSRWVRRLLSENAETPEALEVKTERFTKRVLNTLTEEVDWEHKRRYCYYADHSVADFHVTVYSLCRIARQEIPLTLARRLQPFPSSEPISRQVA